MIQADHGPVFPFLVIFQGYGDSVPVPVSVRITELNGHRLHPAVAKVLVLSVRFLPEPVFDPDFIEGSAGFKEEIHIRLAQLRLFRGELVTGLLVAVDHAEWYISFRIFADNIAGGIRQVDRNIFVSRFSVDRDRFHFRNQGRFRLCRRRFGSRLFRRFFPGGLDPCAVSFRYKLKDIVECVQGLAGSLVHGSEVSHQNGPVFPVQRQDSAEFLRVKIHSLAVHPLQLACNHITVAEGQLYDKVPLHTPDDPDPGGHSLPMSCPVACPVVVVLRPVRRLLVPKVGIICRFKRIVPVFEQIIPFILVVLHRHTAGNRKMQFPVTDPGHDAAVVAVFRFKSAVGIILPLQFRFNIKCPHEHGLHPQGSVFINRCDHLALFVAAAHPVSGPFRIVQPFLFRLRLWFCCDFRCGFGFRFRLVCDLRFGFSGDLLFRLRFRFGFINIRFPILLRRCFGYPCSVF